MAAGGQGPLAIASPAYRAGRGQHKTNRDHRQGGGRCPRTRGQVQGSGRTDPRGRDYFWNSSVYRLGETEGDTDVAALRDKYISVTPLQFDLTHRALLEEMNDWHWRL